MKISKIGITVPSIGTARACKSAVAVSIQGTHIVYHRHETLSEGTRRMTHTGTTGTQVFVFTKPGTEAGETLIEIVKRKETERVAGNGVFWWGVGNSLGDDLSEAAMKAGGRIPILFVAHDRPAPPKNENVNPSRIVRWTKWRAKEGASKDVPAFANITSRWDEKKRLHHALVCMSEVPLSIDLEGPRFDPMLCKTYAMGRVPGASQVTALVRGDLGDRRHQEGRYRILFRANLVLPWQAKLVAYQ